MGAARAAPGGRRTPWGAARGDLPTDLGLWLVGLGVGLDYNPPRSPQHNGVVERSRGTAKRWVEPRACDTPEELRRRLGEMDEVQSGVYPSVGGRSRLGAHSGRAFAPGWEEANWSLEAVATHPARYAGRKRMGASGSISVYDRDRYVGVSCKSQMVHSLFDPMAREWVVADDEGRQLSRQAAPEITREWVMGLTVSSRD